MRACSAAALAAWTLALLAVLAQGPAWGQPLPPVPPQLKHRLPVFSSGQWSVMRSPGQPARCTGVHRTHRSAVLLADRLLLRSPVEITEVALGFDAAPLRPPRAVRDDEREAGALVLQGEEFRQLQAAASVRVEARTTQGSGSMQIDLSGLPAALKNIRAGCPEPAPVSPPRTPAPARTAG